MNKNVVYSSIALAVFVVLVSFALWYRSGTPTGNAVETIIVIAQDGPQADFAQSEEGTMVLEFRATPQDIAVSDWAVTKIQLFRSRTIPGMAVYYLYNETKVQAGLPRMNSTKVELLDGVAHQIVYTFKKGLGQQLYVDQKLVAESIYEPSSLSTVTGFGSFSLTGNKKYIGSEAGFLDVEILESYLSKEVVS
jgi:hypothetical protein